MLAELIATGLRGGLIRPTMLQRVNVDTTVQEKCIRFPTGARHYNRMRERLVRLAQQRGLALRQSYARVGQHTLARQQRSAAAQQFRRARCLSRRLKTLLGRVVRDIEGKTSMRDTELVERLVRAAVFGATAPRPAQALQCPRAGSGVPGQRQSPQTLRVRPQSESGHHLAGQLDCGRPSVARQPLRRPHAGRGISPGATDQRAEAADGVRGSGLSGARRYGRVRGAGHAAPTPSLAALAATVDESGRAAIEPVIGHLKADHRMERNRLKGKRGDRLNAVLSACGFNLRKLLRAFFCPDWPAILTALESAIPARPSLQMC